MYLSLWSGLAFPPKHYTYLNQKMESEKANMADALALSEISVVLETFPSAYTNPHPSTTTTPPSHHPHPPTAPISPGSGASCRGIALLLAFGCHMDSTGLMRCVP